MFFENLPTCYYSIDLFNQLGRILTTGGTLVLSYSGFDIYKHVIKKYPDRRLSELYKEEKVDSNTKEQVNSYFNEELNYSNVRVINVSEFREFNRTIIHKWFNLSSPEKFLDEYELKSKVTFEY